MNSYAWITLLALLQAPAPLPDTDTTDTDDHSAEPIFNWNFTDLN